MGTAAPFSLLARTRRRRRRSNRNILALVASRNTTLAWPNILQIHSFKIRQPTNFILFVKADRQTMKLWNCAIFGRVYVSVRTTGYTPNQANEYFKVPRWKYQRLMISLFMHGIENFFFFFFSFSNTYLLSLLFQIIQQVVVRWQQRQRQRQKRRRTSVAAGAACWLNRLIRQNKLTRIMEAIQLRYWIDG